jgi:flagellar basal-body rod modification protein FlgD
MQGLGKEDFLKMLIVELQNQDPTNPVDSKEMLAQLAQYSSLEQMTNLSSSVAALVSQQNATTAISMIGKTVSFIDPSGNVAAGTVDQVSMLDGTPKLLVNGQAVDLGSIMTVM